MSRPTLPAPSKNLDQNGDERRTGIDRRTFGTIAPLFLTARGSHTGMVSSAFTRWPGGSERARVINAGLSARDFRRRSSRFIELAASSFTALDVRSASRRLRNPYR